MSSIPDATPPPAPTRRSLWLVLGIGVIGVALGIWLVMTMLPQWLGPEGTTGSVPKAADGDVRKIHATLFYVADDGTELVPQSREVPLGSTPAEQAREIVNAQLQPAPAGVLSAIPEGTKVRAVYLTAKNEAFVDLSREIMAGHPGGSLNETLTVFAIVNAVTVNLPDVAGVQILIEGRETDTLAGHLDLRHPLGRSLKWVRRQ